MSLLFAFISFPETKVYPGGCCPENKGRKQSLQWWSRDYRLSAIINHEYLTSEIYETSIANICDMVGDVTNTENNTVTKNLKINIHL